MPREAINIIIAAPILSAITNRIPSPSINSKTIPKYSNNIDRIVLNMFFNVLMVVVLKVCLDIGVNKTMSGL